MACVKGSADLLWRVIVKAVEIALKILRPIDIKFFCDQLPSLVLEDVSVKPAVLHVFIPFRDRWELTEQCLNSLAAQSWAHISPVIHLIDNGSSSATVEKMRGWMAGRDDQMKIQATEMDMPFNFSKLCNHALSLPSDPERETYFLFLNNDVILNQTESIETVLKFATQIGEFGAIGITLVYTDHKIQHLFAAPFVKVIAAHPFKGKNADILSEWNTKARQVPAVTGAFFLVKARVFQQAGGFDEKLPTAGQDIDFCLRMNAQGLANWVLPQVQATHLESASRRGSPLSRTETQYFYQKWTKRLTEVMPLYPPTISRWSEQPVWSLGEGPFPYEKILK